MIPTSMYWRQLGIVPPEDLARAHVTLIGAGGIGSQAGSQLAKMGVTQMTVYDHDTVELHNVPNQRFRLSDIGKPKVSALKEIIREECGVAITAIAERFTDQQIKPGIVVVGVDSMDTRMAIWQRVKFKPNVRFYIEGRMGAQVMRLYSFNPCLPQCVAWYEQNMLYPDSQAQDLPCTAQSIIYNTNLIAAHICHTVSEFVQGRKTPWETIFDFTTLQFLVYP